MKSSTSPFLPSRIGALAVLLLALFFTAETGKAAPGLVGEYFENSDFTSLKATRTDSTVNFNWGTGVPHASVISPDTFSVRWTGQVIAAVSGSHTFRVDADDQVRLWVNEKLLVNTWNNPNGISGGSGAITLVSGLQYDVKLEYRDVTGGANVSLQWEYPGQVMQVIPSAQLSTIRNGLFAEYYNHQTLTNLAFARTDPIINFSWGTNSPEPTRVQTSGFSIRWTGTVTPPVSGSYTFYTTLGDPGDGVRLLVNNVIVIDQWNTHTAAEYSAAAITLTGNTPYNITMEYYDPAQGGQARASLQWEGPGIAKQPIPQGQLSPSYDINKRQQERRFPANANLIDVVALYGAKGDGVTDDTLAIQRAISENIEHHRLIYFPSGTYLVRNTLKWVNRDGAWRAYLGFIGDGPGNTTIRLENNSPGYESGALAPKAVVMTGSHPSPGAYTTSIGEGNQAFNNSIYDLTIDTGIGNPRAIGLDYMANNRGTVSGVVIRSGDGAGEAAISMTRRYPGPALIQNVILEGFDYGVKISRPDYGITFDNLTLRNQIKAGIRNEGNVLSIHRLVSFGSAPVIQNTIATGFVAIANGTFTGASPQDTSAIQNNGQLFARSLSCSGFTSVISGVAGMTIVEYTSSLPANLFGTRSSSLNLPVSPTPTFFDDNLNNWVDVTAFGANGQDSMDDFSAIQAAVDATIGTSKTTVYFPSGGTYMLSAPIRVRGNIRKIAGFSSAVRFFVGAFQDAQNVQPYFRFEQTANDVIMEGVDYSQGNGDAAGAVWVEHASPKAVVIKGCSLTGRANLAYRNTATGTGRLFVEDSIGKMWRVNHPQSVFARQINFEGMLPAGVAMSGMLRNTGGSVWISGLKTESPGRVIETLNSGVTEVIGGLLYPVTSVPASDIAFSSTNSSVSLSYAETAYDPGTWYPTHVRETRGAQTLNYLRSNALPRGSGRMVPLFIGHDRTPQTALYVVGNPTLGATDSAVKSRLEGLGFTVTVVDDSLSQTADANGKSLVVIANSALVTQVDTKFRDVEVPVVCNKAYLYPPMKMTAGAYGTAANKTLVNVSSAGAAHPLGAGFNVGSRTVYTTTANLDYGRATAGGTNIAMSEGQTTLWAIFCYDKDANMEEGFLAPARRVGFFIGNNATLTADGWTLFDAAVNWAITE